MTATWRILHGDARDQLATLPERSVQTCVTSPPYFGLRDYGTGTWDGGDPECDHRPTTIREGRNEDRQSMRDGVVATNAGQLRHWAGRQTCDTCGATKTDSQIGLETTVDEYVTALVAVFRAVRRVLRDDGTIWLNLGDSYNAYNGNRGPAAGLNALADGQRNAPERGLTDAALKPKDLIGVPWRVAFALQADGWYLRSEIIWAKPNPMPESVTDRPTRAHEQVFMLAKQPRYFWDADAIREEVAGEFLSTGVKNPRHGRPGGMLPSEAEGLTSPKTAARDEQGNGTMARFSGQPDAGRNKRSVWTVATTPYAGAHFATFPPKLIEPCILAGSPERACGECGAPWTRVSAAAGLDEMARSSRPQKRRAAELALAAGLTDDHLAAVRATGPADVGQAAATQNGVNAPETARLAAEAKDALGGYFREFGAPEQQTVGFEPSCDHNDPTGQAIVLDPFAGSGTTGVVALRHDRSFVGVELNAEYVELARRRICDDAPLFNTPAET